MSPVGGWGLVWVAWWRWPPRCAVAEDPAGVWLSWSWFLVTLWTLSCPTRWVFGWLFLYIVAFSIMIAQSSVVGCSFHYRERHNEKEQPTKKSSKKSKKSSGNELDKIRRSSSVVGCSDHYRELWKTQWEIKSTLAKLQWSCSTRNGIIAMQSASILYARSHLFVRSRKSSLGSSLPGAAKLMLDE